MRWNFSRWAGSTIRSATMCSPPVSSDVSPNRNVPPARDEPLREAPDGRVAAEPRRRVGLPALGADHQLLQGNLFALQAGGLVHEVLGRAAGTLDRRQIAVPLDRERHHRLAGAGDAVGDPLGPVGLDADDDDGCHVGVAAGTDQGAEVQVEIGPELQPTVRVRQRHRALHDPPDRLDRRVGHVVDRQQQDVVAAADGAVGTPVPRNVRPALMPTALP